MRFGYVALVGRPNVGKSTLLNRLLGQKLSIVSAKPQTTRHRILGIKTTSAAQMVFIDTPGLHHAGQRAMNRYLNRSAESALGHADVIVWLIDQAGWTSADEVVRQRVSITATPVILAINKADRLTDKTLLLPFLKAASDYFPFREIVPISALKGANIGALETSVVALLPAGDPVYPEDQLSDRPLRFFAAELIREKLLYRLGQEIPYALTVSIESFKETPTLATIHATIWVERSGQKAIVIGRQGTLLKEAGTAARRELQSLLDRRVNLQLWVKVREGWSDNDAALRSLGYAD